MSHLSSLGDKEIGDKFAELARKFANRPVRECNARLVDVNAKFDECTGDTWNNALLDDNFDDDDGDDDDNDARDASTVIDKLPTGYIDVDGSRMHIENYLGDQWKEECIMPLENVSENELPASLAAVPHPWQSIGAFQMDYLCKSCFRGGICGDEMGMGKTLLAIIAMMLAENEPGSASFSIVVCPASCKLQWQREILAAYKNECQPKILVLEDSQKTAHAIHAEKWDVIIVSYHLLASQYRAVLKFQQKLRRHREENTPHPGRLPVAGLISGFWQLFDLPAKRLIVDECQLIKKDKGIFYKAVSKIYHKGVIMLSGTPFSNRWTDIANLVRMLQAHPFDTHAKFVRAFSIPQPKKSIFKLEPDTTSLQRFLLAFFRARPSESLALPGVSKKDAHFSLNDIESGEVMEATRKYGNSVVAIAKNKRASETGPALGLAVKAQLWAAHGILGSRLNSANSDAAGFLEIGEDPDDFVVHLASMHEDESTQSRKDWLKELSTMDSAELAEASRIKALIKTIRYSRENFPDEKIVIFSCFLRFLDIAHHAIKNEFNIDCLRYDGTLDIKQKGAVQEEFSETTGSTILLITSGAGGVGLNLQNASIVIQCEVWWNHNVERQAWARCLRQGQTKEVKIIRLLGVNSEIDKTILQCQMRKTKQNNTILTGLIRPHDAPLVVPEYRAGVW